MTERGRKRAREEGEEAVPSGAADDATPTPAAVPPQEEDDDAPIVSSFKMSKAVRKGHECPYLDTISRQVSIPLHRTRTTRP